MVAIGPILLFWHLHGLWNPEGAYAYGWAVPLLAAFLFKSRWDVRPPPSSCGPGSVYLAMGFALLTLPAHWLLEAAPERSICAWLGAIAGLGLSLALLARVGGLPWLRWFSFPLLFILTSVPWPHGVELPVSNSLMHATAAATVEILCLIGVPSVQAGNLVHIETGVIDVDEACSGIRSLQAMIMISLFLGELFRLKPARRLWLVGIGLTVTVIANVVRTVALSSIGFSQGIRAVDHYHDAAGFAVLGFSLLSTLGVAFLLRPAQASVTPPDTSLVGLPFPLKISLALLVWFSVEEISVESWYRLHEPKWQGWSWAVQWPEKSETFHFIEIPQRSLRLLLCDDAHAAAWREPGGSDWSLYWIRWNPGNPEAEAAKVHRPDVCLNAEGATMEKDLGTHLEAVGGTQIPFHSYTFRVGDKILYVFFCLHEERTGALPVATDSHFEEVDMFQRALQGRRHVGQQSLEFAISGYPSERSAQEAFKARLGQLIHAGSGSIP